MTKKRAVVILGALISMSEVHAQTPTKITECQTISATGSYELANDLNAAGDCLIVDAEFITIDLAGFIITGNNNGTGVRTSREDLRGTVVRNGSISGFAIGVNLLSSNSVVEELRVFGNTTHGILANGIIRNNIVQDNGSFGIASNDHSIISGNLSTNNVFWILSSGNDGSIVNGNNVRSNRQSGIRTLRGSTVTGNTSTANGETGISVDCPLAVIGNTAIDNARGNLEFVDNGCNDVDNIAPIIPPRRVPIPVTPVP